MCTLLKEQCHEIFDFWFFHESFSAKPLTCEYLREFSEKFETVLMGYSGAGAKLIHEKKPEAKNPFNVHQVLRIRIQVIFSRLIWSVIGFFFWEKLEISDKQNLLKKIMFSSTPSYHGPRLSNALKRASLSEKNLEDFFFLGFAR